MGDDEKIAARDFKSERYDTVMSHPITVVRPDFAVALARDTTDGIHPVSSTTYVRRVYMSKEQVKNFVPLMKKVDAQERHFCPVKLIGQIPLKGKRAECLKCRPRKAAAVGEEE